MERTALYVIGMRPTVGRQIARMAHASRQLCAKGDSPTPGTVPGRGLSPALAIS